MQCELACWQSCRFMLAAEADAYSKAKYCPTHQNSKRRYRKQKKCRRGRRKQMPSMNDAWRTSNCLAPGQNHSMAESNIAKRNNATYPSLNSTSANVECEAMLLQFGLNVRSSTGATREVETPLPHPKIGLSWIVLTHAADLETSIFVFKKP